jgi:hypothetical protein
MTSNILKELILKFSLDNEQDEQKCSVDKVVTDGKWTDFLQKGA